MIDSLSDLAEPWECEDIIPINKDYFELSKDEKKEISKLCKEYLRKVYGVYKHIKIGDNDKLKTL